MPALLFCGSDSDRTRQNSSQWNLHEFRSQRHSDIPSGKDGLLYYVPEILGGRDYGPHVDLDNLEICLDLYSSPEKMYSEDIEELAHCLIP